MVVGLGSLGGLSQLSGLLAQPSGGQRAGPGDFCMCLRAGWGGAVWVDCYTAPGQWQVALWPWASGGGRGHWLAGSGGVGWPPMPLIHLQGPWKTGVSLPTGQSWSPSIRWRDTGAPRPMSACLWMPPAMLGPVPMGPCQVPGFQRLPTRCGESSSSLCLQVPPRSTRYVSLLVSLPLASSPAASPQLPHTQSVTPLHLPTCLHKGLRPCRVSEEGSCLLAVPGFFPSLKPSEEGLSVGQRTPAASPRRSPLSLLPCWSLL